MTQERFVSGHLVRRLLALTMALALVLSMYLGLRAQIRFSGLNYVGQISEYAARVTAENTGYLSENTLDRAWTILRATIRRPRTYEDYEMYASIAIAREDYAGAAEYLQGCIDTSRGDDAEELATLHLRQASVYVLTEEYDKALSRLDRTLELAPTLSPAWFLRAQLNAAAGETDKATADLAAYKDLDGSDPVILSSLGPLYESAGDYESAIECYTAGLTDERAYQVNWFSYRARCRLQLGDTAGAKQDLEEYFSRKGDDPKGEAAAMLAVCRMDEGDYPGALSMFHRSAADGEKAIALAEAGGESSTELHFWTGLAYMVQEEYTAAAEHFTAAQEKDETLRDISYYLGICALGQGDTEQAIEQFTASVEREENVTASLYNRAVCYLQLGQELAARTDLNAVRERDDDPDLTAQAQELLSTL